MRWVHPKQQENLQPAEIPLTMPWDHINKAINRSLPLQQPSKAASSHSSICTNSRQRNPGLRKPHLLSCCFYLSLHCISCQACRSERQEISSYLFVPWCDQGMCLGWNPALGQGCVGRECCRNEGQSEEKRGWALVAVLHQHSRLTQVRVGAGAQTASPIALEKPAFLLHSHRTHGGLDLAFPELSSQCPSRQPQNTGFFILTSQTPAISLVILLAKGRILCTPRVF